MTDLDLRSNRETDIELALDRARELAALGVPVFVARRDKSGKTEFRLPKGWQTTTADPAVVDRWQPGDALCAVTHGPLSVLDLDPEPGVCTTEELLTQLGDGGLTPYVYATAYTPSGGLHLLVAHLDTATGTGLPIPGVDLRAGYTDGSSGGFVYLAPTERAAKHGADGERLTKQDRLTLFHAGSSLVPYRWLTWDLSGLSASELALDFSGETLVEAVAKARASKNGTEAGQLMQSRSDVGGERWTKADALRRIAERRSVLMAAPETGCRDELLGYTWDLARFTHAGLMPFDDARKLYVRTCREKWGELDSNDKDMWNNTRRKLMAEDFDMAVILSDEVVRPGTADDEGVAADPKPERIQLPSPTQPAAVAREILADLADKGRPVIVSNDEWYSYGDTVPGCYERLSGDQIQSLLYRYTEHAVFLSGDKIKRWAPKTSTIRDLTHTMARLVDIYTRPGGWTGKPSQRPATTGFLVPCRNGVLDTGTREVLPHDPRWFFTHQVPLTYDADAQCPVWLSALAAQWGDQPDTIAAFQEWFGYVLSGRTDLHKAAFLYGPRRSFKGTASRVLQMLLGAGTAQGLSLASFASEYGLSGCLHASLLILGDVRWSGVQGKSQVVSKILEITGEDTIGVPRKYKEAWSGKLPGRLMFLSNDELELPDSSGALASRFLVFGTTTSFLGREDPSLEPRILAELAGVLNWALAGLERLEARGKFTEPEGSADRLADMEQAGSPVAGFVADCCERIPDSDTPVPDLYAAYLSWCDAHRLHPTDVPRFGSRFRSIVPQPTNRVRRWVDGQYVTFMRGVRLTVPADGGDFAEPL